MGSKWRYAPALSDFVQSIPSRSFLIELGEASKTRVCDGTGLVLYHTLSLHTGAHYTLLLAYREPKHHD